METVSGEHEINLRVGKKLIFGGNCF